MSQNYPFSIPTGVNLIPRGSGSSSLGSSDFPFEAIYVNSIISSGGTGEFVNVTGDTMTGYLVMDPSAGISGNQTLNILAESGLYIGYDNATNSAAARIVITGLTANAQSKLEMTGNVVRLSYDEGVSNGFGHIEFNGDGFTTIVGGQSAGSSQLTLGPAQFSFLAPSAGGLEASFSGTAGVLGFNTSSFVGNKNANVSINAGQSVIFDFNDSVTPFTGNVSISSTGVVLSGVNIYPHTGNAQKIGDYEPFTSIDTPFNTMAATNIFATTIKGMSDITIRSHNALSAAKGSTEYTIGSIESEAIDASSLVVLRSNMDSSSAFWKTSLTSPGGGSFISGTTSNLELSISNPGGGAAINLTPNTITLTASGPGQPALLPSNSGIDIGSAAMHWGTIYVDNVVSTGISAGSFVATSGGSMYGDLTMTGSSILATGIVGNIGSLETPFAQIYAGTGNFHAISGLSPLGILSDLSIGSGNNINPEVSGATNIGTTSNRIGNIYTNTINNSATRSIAWNEVPAGWPNGILTDFTIGNTPYDNWSVQLFVNGLYQAPSGIGAAYFDFSMSGSTIQMVIPPPSGSILIANYQY